MPNESFKKLYVDELKDLYSAENQLVKALPKMAKAASSEELREGFEEHLEQTKGQVQRLETIFQSLNESPKGKKCMGMEGLVKEGSEVMEEDLEDAVLDAALIGAAQRVELRDCGIRHGLRVCQSPRRNETRFFAGKDFGRREGN